MITVMTDAGRFEYPDGVTYDIDPMTNNLTIHNAVGGVEVVHKAASWQRIVHGREERQGPLVA